MKWLFSFFLMGTVFLNSGYGQVIYSFGFVESLTNNNIQLPVNTDPILFAQSEKCINLNNGIPKFIFLGKTMFDLSCLLNEQVKKIEVQLYPIPTKNQLTIKSKKNTVVDGAVSVFIIDNSGRVIKTEKATIAQLESGHQISVLSIQSGLYVLSLVSSKNELLGSYKFIIMK